MLADCPRVGNPGLKLANTFGVKMDCTPSGAREFLRRECRQLRVLAPLQGASACFSDPVVSDHRLLSGSPSGWPNVVSGSPNDCPKPKLNHISAVSLTRASSWVLLLDRACLVSSHELNPESPRL